VAAGAGDAVAAGVEAVANVMAAGVGEAIKAGTGVVTGVATAGAVSITDWAGSEGTMLSIGRKGEDKALFGDLCMAGWEGVVFAGGLAGRGFIQDKRLFF
jgi:hypothetical protein